VEGANGKKILSHNCKKKMEGMPGAGGQKFAQSKIIRKKKNCTQKGKFWEEKNRTGKGGPAHPA